MLLSAAGCDRPRHITHGIEEPRRMTEAILRQIPAGTPIDDAQQFMEQEGFKCSREDNEAFRDPSGMNYIYCVRSEGSIVTRRWQVAVVHRKGKVVEVLAITWLIGP
jgi:hypothetical protein